MYFRSRASIKGRLFEGSIDLRGESIAYFRSRASIKGRLFKGSIGLRGGSIVYFSRLRLHRSQGRLYTIL